MPLRIIITGGSGKAGQYIISTLLSAGHTVLNLDLVPPSDATLCAHPSLFTLKTDLTSSGQVFNALTGQWTLSEPFPPGPPPRADALIHLANYSRNMLVPDNECFRVNTLSTYHVLEAACKLGIPKIIVASSVTAYGVTFAQGDVDFASFPVDETVPSSPTDAYAMSKLVGEVVAKGFSERFAGKDIYVFRIGRVVAPNEYREEMFESYVTQPERWKPHGWSYTDARDLGRMCVCALETDGLGFQVFNATNDSITNDVERNADGSTEGFLKRVCPRTRFTRTMGKREAPFTNEKMKRLLGFREEHDWKRYYYRSKETDTDIEGNGEGGRRRPPHGLQRVVKL